MIHPRATLDRIARGRGILTWLARAVIAGGRWRVPAALLSSAIGILMQAAAFGVIVLFVHVQTSETPVEAGGWTIPASVTPLSVTVWSLTVLLVAVIGAAAAYFGEAAAFTAGRLAMHHVIDRGLDVLVRSARTPTPFFRDPSAAKVARRALMGDSTAVLRTSLQLFRLTVAATGFLVYFAFLLTLDVTLTALVVGLLVISLAPLYWLNRGVVTASRDYEDQRRRRSAVLGRFLDFARVAPPVIGTRPAWTDAYLAQPALRSATIAFRHIILARRRVGFLQRLLFGVVLAAVLVMHVSMSTPGEPRWGPLITFLIAFRLAAAHMTSAATLLTAMNRFLPQLTRLRAFVQAGADELPPERIDAADDPLPRVRAGEPALPGSDDAYAVQRGGVLLAVVDALPSAYTLPFLCNRLTRSTRAGAALLRHSALCVDLPGPPPLPVIAVMTGEVDPTPDTRVRAEHHAATWGVDLDTPLDDAVWAALSPRTRLELYLAPAVLDDRAVMWVAWRLLSRLTRGDREQVLASLEDRALILLATPPLAEAPTVVDHTLVFYDGAVRGMGSPRWYAELDHDRLRVDGFQRAAAEQIDEDDVWDDEED